MSVEPPAVSRPALLRCTGCGTMNRIDLLRLADRPRCASCSSPLAADRPQRVAAEDFWRVVESAGVPVLVDFYADWCGPCRAMAPLLEEFAARQAGRALVLQVDTDRDPGLAAEFRIRGIPTLISFRDGAEVRRHVGMAGPAELAALLV